MARKCACCTTPVRKEFWFRTPDGPHRDKPPFVVGYCCEAFKRWTYAGSGWARQDSLLVFRGSEDDVKFLIRKLNAERATLPTGRKARKGAGT